MIKILDNIIKLKDEDCMHTHTFCSSCHYWLFGEDRGVNYCPHCGIKLFWNSEKMSKVHENWYEISIERYNQLKNNVKNIKTLKDVIEKNIIVN
jgi:hypothetical protein